MAGPMMLCCDVCRRRKRILVGDRAVADVHLCEACHERLDQLDRDHRRPAFLFAREIMRNREYARAEGIQ